MLLTAEAKSKLLLFGEHAAIYGYPALGIPLPWKVRVSLTPAKKTSWETPPLTEKQRRSLEQLASQLPMKAHIQVDSEIPIGVGLGSSAALCVALAKALAEELAVWRLAHQLESVFHHAPSGIDTGISLHECPCSFIGQDDDLPLATQLKDFNVPLVIGALKRSSDTAALIEKVSSQEGAKKHLKALGEIAKQAINAQDQLGTLANQAHEHLASLQLSTPELDIVLDKGKAFGALGGKLSGAGGGGAYFLIAKSFEEAEQIAEQLLADPAVQKLPHCLLPQVVPQVVSI